MNLSSYLQMPPAPSVSTSPTSSPVQGPAAGTGAPSGNGLGLDFAQLMTKQFQQLSAAQRQDLAAVTRQAEAANRAQAQTDDRALAQSQDNAQRTDRYTHADTRASDIQTAERQATEAPIRDERNELSANTTHARSRQRVANTRPSDEMPPSWMPQHALQRPVTPPEEQAPANTSSRAATDGGALRTIELSPQVRIITDPGKAPSPESLTAFAKAMGLDESAIQKLMGPVDTNSTAQAEMVTADANGLTQPVPTPGIISTSNAPSAPNALLAALQAHTEPRSPLAIQIASHVTPSQGVAPVTAPLTQASMVTNMPTTLTSLDATMALQSPLQPMTAADMASIQQIQITVLPAAVLPAGIPSTGSNPAPSTLDVLSLLGSTAQEADISALASAFSQDEAGDQGNPSQGQPSDSGTASGFTQTLTRPNTTHTAAVNASTQATSSPHMSEVYDQLSDKLATEMAARMHKQLSDGEWKMKFGLRPANLGGVEIQLEMKDGKLDAVFRADNPLTRDLLQNSSQRLRDALENFGIQAGQVQIGHQANQQQHNPSHGSAKQPQVRDNSPLQVNASTDSTPVTARNKANASLLDLYA